jgi:cytochrome P450
LPYVISQLRGELQHHIVELHENYGEVVRVLPNELSFASADSWKDIYGHRKAGQLTLNKFPQFYGQPFHDGVHNIIDADDATHARMRRVFAHAFSDRALKLQESLFLTYVDRLVHKLRETIAADPAHKFNMVMMYNFTTFDIMGDLTFGEPLDLLNDPTYHGWIRSMFANFKFGAYLHSIRYFPFLESGLLRLISLTSLDKKRKEHSSFSSSRVDRRLEKQDARPDIWGLVLARDAETGLSKLEMYKNAGLFMLAGTETTATLLSGLTYHLLKNEEKMQKLVEEIRTSFSEEKDLTIERLQALPYLHACIEEGLRMYPPVSNGLPRVVPPTGAVVDGRDIPSGTVVYTHQLSTYRNPRNFRDPYEFRPERWLNNDHGSNLKHALNPFSVGPRACLGKK